MLKSEYKKLFGRSVNSNEEEARKMLRKSECRKKSLANRSIQMKRKLEIKCDCIKGSEGIKQGAIQEVGRKN